MNTAWICRLGTTAGLLLAASAIGGEEPMTNALQAAELSTEIRQPVRMKYWLYLPPAYERDATARWPLMIFLHGAGERGDDLAVVRKHGPPKQAVAGRELPFVLLAPQCPSNDWWTSWAQIGALKALIDDACAKHRIDRDRIYLTGLSMGGYGTWRMAQEYPDLFAAIAPICGGGQPLLAGKIRQVPVWAFHGAKDPVVPLRESEAMVEALRKAGAKVEFTVYPDAQHDAWTAAYDDPALYAWFLQQKRGAPAPH